jgi:hypothetical protein
MVQPQGKTVLSVVAPPSLPCLCCLPLPHLKDSNTLFIFYIAALRIEKVFVPQKEWEMAGRRVQARTKLRGWVSEWEPTKKKKRVGRSENLEGNGSMSCTGTVCTEAGKGDFESGALSGLANGKPDFPLACLCFACLPVILRWLEGGGKEREKEGWKQQILARRSATHSKQTMNDNRMIRMKKTSCCCLMVLSVERALLMLLDSWEWMKDREANILFCYCAQTEYEQLGWTVRV